MPAEAALNEEEQKLFDEMSKDGGADAAKAAKEAADKAAADKAASDKAAKDAAEKAKEGEKKEEKVVPLQALHEAREQNKELRKELEAMKSAVADGDKRLKDALARIEAKADAGPDFNENPAAHLKHENAELKKGLAELNAKLAKQEQSAEQDSQMKQHATLVASKEASFAKQHPDYFKASEHVATLWREEYVEAGFDEAEIPKLVFAKALGITHKAVQAGRDPAEAIYKIAKKYGFAAPQKEEKKEDGESKLKAIAKGLEAAKGAGGGAGPDEDSGLAGLAELDDAELEKRVNDKDWWAKNIRGRSSLH